MVLKTWDVDESREQKFLAFSHRTTARLCSLDTHGCATTKAERELLSQPILKALWTLSRTRRDTNIGAAATASVLKFAPPRAAEIFWIVRLYFHGGLVSCHRSLNIRHQEPRAQEEAGAALR